MIAEKNYQLTIKRIFSKITIMLKKIILNFGVKFLVKIINGF